MARYYIQQYGHFWRCTREKFLEFLQFGAKGEGDWNLNWYGRELRRTPPGVRLFKNREDGEWWEAVRPDVYVIKPLDWRPDDFRDALDRKWP